MSIAITDAISAIIVGGRAPSANQRTHIGSLLWGSLHLDSISSKPEKREASINKITVAIANIEALEKHSKAINLLNMNIKKDVRQVLREAKKKMHKLLEDLQSKNKNVNTPAPVRLINDHIRSIMP